eukprot:SAG31_NODE_4493_length_3188_cov_2.660084_2_plen_61_part_00
MHASRIAPHVARTLVLDSIEYSSTEYDTQQVDPPSMATALRARTYTYFPEPWYTAPVIIK